MSEVKEDPCKSTSVALMFTTPVLPPETRLFPQCILGVNKRRQPCKTASHTLSTETVYYSSFIVLFITFELHIIAAVKRVLLALSTVHVSVSSLDAGVIWNLLPVFH